jgi:uncharacterized membrane protein YjjP (DUF1212 family)
MNQQDRQNIAVAVVVIVLIVAGVWLMNTMRRNGQVEDCLMAHRRNCDALLN